MLRQNGQVVGFCGLIPSRFQHAGKEKIVFTVSTWMVSPEHRSDSLRLFFKVVSAAKQTMLFCTTPGDATIAVLQALKFDRLPHEDQRRSVVVIDPRRFISALLHGRFRRASMMTKVIAPMLGRLLAAVQAFRLRGRVEAQAGIEVRDVSEADGPFDALWARTRSRVLNTNVRDAKAINWLCFSGRDFQKKLFGCYRAGRLVGYAVFRLDAGNRLNLRMIECLDLWLESLEAPLLESIVAAARTHAAEHAYDLVVFPHFTSELGESLKRLGLFQIAERERRAYAKTGGVAADGITAANSYLVTAQGDDGV